MNNSVGLINEVKELCDQYSTFLLKKQGTEEIYAHGAQLDKHIIHMGNFTKKTYYQSLFFSQELFDILDMQRQITYDINKKKYNHNAQRLEIYGCRIVIHNDDILIVGPLWDGDEEKRRMQYGGIDGVLLKNNEAIILSSYRTSHHGATQHLYCDLGTDDERLMSFFEGFKHQIEEALRKS